MVGVPFTVRLKSASAFSSLMSMMMVPSLVIWGVTIELQVRVYEGHGDRAALRPALLGGIGDLLAAEDGGLLVVLGHDLGRRHNLQGAFGFQGLGSR
jgi:hypothetical protein